jgi:glycosyltransferase involved in cell wall biosynthesis
MAMFALSLAKMNTSVGVLSLPRGSWTCRATEGTLDLQDRRTFSARFGRECSSRFSAVFCFHWAMLPIACALGRLWRVPVVYDEHDDYELNSLEGGGNPVVRRLVQRAIRTVHRLLVPKTDLVTCIDQTGRYLEQRLLKLNNRVVPLANYPDSRWQWRNRPETGPVRFLYAGGVFAEKGVLSALEAFKLLDRPAPGKSRLDIFGQGDPELMRRLAAEPGVTVHGEVSGDVLRDFATEYRSVGLAMLANSTRYNRVGTNMTKLYEYLAMGMPVIVSDTGDTGEFVRRTGIGLAVTDVTDVPQILRSMQRLAEEDELYNSCSLAARNLMSQANMRWEHEWEKVAGSGILGWEQPGGR